MGSAGWKEPRHEAGIKSPAPQISPNRKIAPLNYLELQRGKCYFCNFIFNWDLSVMKMVLIRTKSLNPHFFLMVNFGCGFRQFGVCWMGNFYWQKQREKHSQLSIGVSKRPSKNSAWLLKTQNQALLFYKHWFLILFYQISKDLLQKIRDTVLQKTVDGMRKEGVPYLGTYKTLGFLIIRGKIFYFAFLSLQPESHWRLRETALICRNWVWYQCLDSESMEINKDHFINRG